MERAANHDKFRQLRERFPFFAFEDYHYRFEEKGLHISFTFNLSDRHYFHPTVDIPYVRGIFEPSAAFTSGVMDNLVFHMGMIELISYWKAACPPRIIIKPHKLEPAQLEWWKTIYHKGLGEFIYMNSIRIPPEGLMEIVPEGKSKLIAFDIPVKPSFLVPVGGGKDSAVTLELIKEADPEWVPFVINSREAIRQVLLVAGKQQDDTLEFIRRLDPLLLELNGKGFLNGHTPFSALVAFYSMTGAVLSGKGSVVLSNESSANEATIPGTDINHQYSKSVDFERRFREYTNKYLTPSVEYFSLLRPLSELQIAAIFSGHPEYFPAFRSCNVGSKTDTWCGKCPKCLFTAIIMAPFVDEDTLRNIFGTNVFDDPDQLDNLYDLAGISKAKPFECVGTIDEVNLALGKIIRDGRFSSEPLLIRQYKDIFPLAGELPPGEFSKALHHFSHEHYVPEVLLDPLKRSLP